MAEISAIRVVISTTYLGNPGVLKHGRCVYGLSLTFGMQHVIGQFNNASRVRMFFLACRNTTSVIQVALPVIIHERRGIKQPDHTSGFRSTALNQQLTGFVLPRTNRRIRGQHTDTAAAIGEIQEELLFTVDGLMSDGRSPGIAGPGGHPLFSSHTNVTLITPIDHVITGQNIDGLYLSERIVLDLPSTVIFIVIIQRAISIHRSAITRSVDIYASVVFHSPRIGAIPIIDNRV